MSEERLEGRVAPQRGAPAGAPAAGGEERLPPLPEGVVAILPLRNAVLFPGVVLPLSVGRRRSVLAVQASLEAERPVGVVLQKEPETEEPGGGDLHLIGTLGNVLRFVTTGEGHHHVICQGVRRFRVIEYVEGFPFLAARVEEVEIREERTPAVEARMNELRRLAIEALGMLPQVPSEVAEAIRNISSPGMLADFVASFMDFESKEKQEVLETFDVEARLSLVLRLLAHRIAVLRLSQEIAEETRQTIERENRERLLREQLRTIRRQLGEEGEREAELEELEKAIEEAGMPEEVKQHARKELRRLERMPEGAAEYGMLRTYLEWLVELPWSKLDEEVIDIRKAREILDADHYDLEKVKRRILEYLAVRKLNPTGKAPILCFVGPPGVGKTSLGQSIARATGRRFVRISLGGVHDEAEIRGHRRTYIGALPGNIIQAIRKAGTRNPVLMLDEVDKLGTGIHGDPAAALLEVLDPEQNHSFRDNYLGVPFDLSQVMFICTANIAETIPGPLRDRMEIIEIPGYTDEEKLQIARRYLVPRQLKQNGLAEEQFSIDDDALVRIIREYTREAGCRNLEREIGSVVRHAAVRIAEGSAQHVHVRAGDIPEILGPPKYESEVAMRTSIPGVATGLAWTPFGGEILFVEATLVPGKGKLILTGQLGDVMRESAQAALTLVKARAKQLGFDPKVFDESDLHVHVPAGAVPKDGPSAGVTIFTAIASLVTGRTVRSDVAMTGEISLRGLVLPVGGIKEKTLAAHRAGIRTVLLPARNRKDLPDIPESVRNELRFVWLETVDDALEHALELAGAVHGGVEAVA
ncbi:Lon protease 2 [bacterium HR39]|nr:Lon protease 2 [bacterium HR39]